jgi:tetratricopeptide (TPR) repeat protein
MNKKWLFIIILFCISITPICYPAQNPSISNPAGVTTIPQSYYGGSLVDTSNPIDTSGNQIITGNVRQGMSFRGNVPYSSPSSFHANLGSSSLSSFMRDSAGAEDMGRYRTSSQVAPTAGTNYQSYYLPSATVTTMSPNRPGVTTQANQSFNNNTQYTVGTQAQLNQPVISTSDRPAQPQTLWQLYNPGLTAAQNQYNSIDEPALNLSSPRQSTEFQSQRQQLSPEQARKYQQDENNLQQGSKPTNQWQQSQIVPRYSPTEPAPTQIQQLMTVQNEYGLTTNTETIRQTEDRLDSTGLQYTSVPYQNKNVQQSAMGHQTAVSPIANNTTYQPYTNSQAAQEQNNAVPDTAQDLKTSEAIAQIQKQLDDLIRSVDSRLQNPTDYTSQYTTTVQGISSPRQTIGSYKPEQLNQDFSVSAFSPEADSPGRSRLQEIMQSSDGFGFTSTQNPIIPPARLNQLSQSQVPTSARQTNDRQTDVETFSQAKYVQLYRAAEGHLNIGRFQQAADAFALASIYNPNDPACYAGRGHALFAAGEYINSALCVIRAIELDPEYINTPVDLVELVGDAKDLNNKIAELNKWLQKSNAPGLGFLLGYVYYHTGRYNDAKKVMDIVAREMPNSTATVALKMAINFKLQTQK